MIRFGALLLMISSAAQAGEQASHTVMVRIIQTAQIAPDALVPANQKLTQTQIAATDIKDADTIVYTLTAR